MTARTSTNSTYHLPPGLGLGLGLGALTLPIVVGGGTEVVGGSEVVAPAVTWVSDWL